MNAPTRSVAACGAAVALLSGCTAIEHVQVLPVVNPNSYDVSCCVAYTEIPPSTRLSLTATHSDAAGVKVKASARWRY
ncbi:hypothetical protein [Burkholderia plantarii]|uniref:hypothetical protein n=1 Tax=Burkholderia plantarii TaxID=41899 RepID=UPI0008709920|nr:hypothetical protein [Burkholderia plantarii]